VRVHKSQALIAGAAALALALGACTSSGGGGGGGGTGTESGGGGGGSKPTGQLIYGEGSDFPENLMPIIAAGNVTSNANILGRVLDGAFRIAPNVSFQMDPDQVTDATSNIVNGQQVVDYKINPKAVWDDGQPITADDYIFTFDNTKAVTDPKTKSPVPVCSKVLGTTGTDQIETAQKVSDTEVKFIFKKGQPFADWKGLFAGASGSSPLLSQHVMDKGELRPHQQGLADPERYPGRRLERPVAPAGQERRRLVQDRDARSEPEVLGRAAQAGAHRLREHRVGLRHERQGDPEPRSQHDLPAAAAGHREEPAGAAGCDHVDQLRPVVRALRLQHARPVARAQGGS
jgi:hypothetical protein